MKPFCKTLILVVLTLSLVLTLFACTKKKENEEDDSWMDKEISVDTGKTASRQGFDDQDGSSYSSGEKVNLPTIPWE